MEYLAMNLHDIELLHRGELTVFVVPASMFSAKSGDVIGIKEPFRKIVAHITATATGEPEDNVDGVQYCFDLKRAWDGGTSPEDLTEYTVDYDESPRCSPASSARYLCRGETAPKFHKERHSGDEARLCLAGRSSDRYGRL